MVNLSRISRDHLCSAKRWVKSSEIFSPKLCNYIYLENLNLVIIPHNLGPIFSNIILVRILDEFHEANGNCRWENGTTSPGSSAKTFYLTTGKKVNVLSFASNLYSIPSWPPTFRNLLWLHLEIKTKKYHAHQIQQLILQLRIWVSQSFLRN